MRGVVCRCEGLFQVLFILFCVFKVFGRRVDGNGKNF